MRARYRSQSVCGVCVRCTPPCPAGYIHASIESADVTGLKCMESGCNVPLPADMISSLASPSHLAKYRRFVGESYVKEQAERGVVKFCPAPDCGHAMDANRLDAAAQKAGALPVRFFCGFEWCFNCQEEAHAPASCGEMKEWHRRFTDDVSWPGLLV